MTDAPIDYHAALLEQLPDRLPYRPRERKKGKPKKILPPTDVPRKRGRPKGYSPSPKWNKIKEHAFFTGEQCAVRYCRGDRRGVTVSFESTKARLCWQHWVKFCQETTGLHEISSWLKKQ